MKRLILSAVAAFCFLGLGAQEYGVVNISVCNLRSTPDFDAEMVSQALLGTPVHIIGNSDSKPYPWPEIDTPDDYSGWVHYAAITRMSFDEYHAWNAAPKAVVTALQGVVYAKSSTRSATVSDVVAGDRLKLIKKRGAWLDNQWGWRSGIRCDSLPGRWLVIIYAKNPVDQERIKAIGFSYKGQRNEQV